MVSDMKKGWQQILTSLTRSARSVAEKRCVRSLNASMLSVVGIVTNVDGAPTPAFGTGGTQLQNSRRHAPVGNTSPAEMSCSVRQDARGSTTKCGYGSQFYGNESTKGTETTVPVAAKRSRSSLPSITSITTDIWFVEGVAVLVPISTTTSFGRNFPTRFNCSASTATWAKPATAASAHIATSKVQRISLTGVPPKRLRREAPVPAILHAGEDIFSSAWRHAAASREAGGVVARSAEDQDSTRTTNCA